MPVLSVNGLTIAMNESCSLPPQAARTETDPLSLLAPEVHPTARTKMANSGTTKARERLKPRTFNTPIDAELTALVPRSYSFYVPSLFLVVAESDVPDLRAAADHLLEAPV